jgi:agmatine deiminase
MQALIHGQVLFLHKLGGSTVFYYVDANANSGKHQVRPITAPEGYWKFNVGLTTGIASIPQNFEIKDIFPNPGSALSCIPVKSNINTKLNVSLFDVAGRLVKQVFNGEITVGDKNLFINCAEFEAGVYNVVYTTNEGQYAKKLCIKK